MNNQKPKKRKPVTIYFGIGRSLPNLTKGEALKIAAEILQDYNELTIKINPNPKTNDY